MHMDSSPVAVYRIHEHLRPKVTKRSFGLQTEDVFIFIFLYLLICIELDPWIVGMHKSSQIFLVSNLCSEFLMSWFNFSARFSLQLTALCSPCSYLSCILMIAYLINSGAASVEMDFIMQLDLIGMQLGLDLLQHIQSWNCYQ